MRKPRPGVTPTLSAVLQDVKEWSADYELTNAGQVPDFKIVYYYLSGPQKQRMEVVKDQLLPGTVEDWPLPGEYEIDVLDSLNESLLEEPWRAQHLDKDSLVRGARSDENPAQVLFEEYRIRLRNQAADRDRAEAKERKAKDELDVAEEKIRKLSRSNAEYQLAAEQAAARQAYAEEKQKEAEAAFEQLETENAELKPHIQMFFDHGFDRLVQFFGAAPAMAANNTGNAPSADGPPLQGNDPMPPGAEDPIGRLDDLFKAVIYDREICQHLVDQGILTWAQVRALVWCRTKVDLGPEPQWAEWAKNADTEPTAGEAPRPTGTG
jgi:hypothetical protein